MRDSQALYTRKLAPFLSQASQNFWSQKGQSYFTSGLYLNGSMGNVCRGLRALTRTFGLEKAVEDVCKAKNMDEQRKVWEVSAGGSASAALLAAAN